MTVARLAPSWLAPFTVRRYEAEQCPLAAMKRRRNDNTEEKWGLYKLVDAEGGDEHWAIYTFAKDAAEWCWGMEIELKSRDLADSCTKVKTSLPLDHLMQLPSDGSCATL